MRYTAVITVILMAMGPAGCSDSEPEQTETKKESSAEAVAAEAKRILEAAAANESPKSVKPPGFFGGGTSRGVRKDDPDEQSTDPLDSLAGPSEPAATQPKPTKRPPPKPVTPDERAEKQVKLAKLYIANAATAPTPAGRKFLSKKAAKILEEVISKHPQAPAATEAARLLKGIETAP